MTIIPPECTLIKFAKPFDSQPNGCYQMWDNERLCLGYLYSSITDFSKISKELSDTSVWEFHDRTPFENSWTRKDQIVPELYQQFSKAFLKDFNHVVQSEAYKYGEVWIETSTYDKVTNFAFVHITQGDEIVWSIFATYAIRVCHGKFETYPFFTVTELRLRPVGDFVDTTDFSK